MFPSVITDLFSILFSRLIFRSLIHEAFMRKIRVREHNCLFFVCRLYSIIRYFFFIYFLLGEFFFLFQIEGNRFFVGVTLELLILTIVAEFHGQQNNGIKSNFFHRYLILISSCVTFYFFQYVIFRLVQRINFSSKLIVVR